MVAAFSLVAVLIGLGAQGPKPQVPSDSRIREMLRVDEFKEEREALVALGAQAFPAYLRILTAKDVEPTDTSRIFGVLTAVKADRSQFLEHAVSGLASPDKLVRLSAVALLAQIGSARDAAPVAALLADKEWEIPFAAAKTLAAIGDQRALTAMDIWLNSGLRRPNAAEYERQRQHIAKCRDELKARLDKVKKPGK